MSHQDLPLRMLVTVAGANPGRFSDCPGRAGTPSRPGHCVSQAQHEISGGCCGCWCVWFERPGRPVAVRRILLVLGGEFDTALGEPYLSRATLLTTSAHLSRQRFGVFGS